MICQYNTICEPRRRTPFHTHTTDGHTLARSCGWLWWWPPAAARLEHQRTVFRTQTVRAAPRATRAICIVLVVALLLCAFVIFCVLLSLEVRHCVWSVYNTTNHYGSRSLSHQTPALCVDPNPLAAMNGTGAPAVITLSPSSASAPARTGPVRSDPTRRALAADHARWR